MSVFPAASGKLVPKSWATLMSDPVRHLIFEFLHKLVFFIIIFFHIGFASNRFLSGRF